MTECAEPEHACAPPASRDGGDEDEDAEGDGSRRPVSSSYAPCRVLLAAGPDAGQEQAAGSLLCLLDGCAVHTVSLPALLTAGATTYLRAPAGKIPMQLMAAHIRKAKSCVFAGHLKTHMLWRTASCKHCFVLGICGGGTTAELIADAVCAQCMLTNCK